MTTGALIFAYNNEHIDYLAMANWSAKNIRRHLNIPVAVVTNVTPPQEYKFEQVIYANTTGQDTREFADIPGRVTWYNSNRVNAYELSPWTQTLVLDADYVVAGNQLSTLLALKQNFIAHKNAYDITGLQTFDDLNSFGRNRMPMLWATVMMFRRSKEAETIFNIMTMIRDNWSHYKNLYGVGRSAYRNDFALSIAANIVSGHTLSTPTIPWGLASLTPEHTLTELEQDKYRVDFLTPANKTRYINIAQDFHAMGKGHLGEIVANNS